MKIDLYYWKAFMWMAQLSILIFSIGMILESERVWEICWPQKFWKLKVAELEKCVKKDLWNLKSVEWEIMKRRMELTIAVSEAEDKAACLEVDGKQYVIRAKEEAVSQLHKLMQEESQAKRIYERTLQLLNEAKERLITANQTIEGVGKIGFNATLKT